MFVSTLHDPTTFCHRRLLKDVSYYFSHYSHMLMFNIFVEANRQPS